MVNTNFLIGENVVIKTTAVHQKTQVALNNKKGIVILTAPNEIYVNLMLRGKSITLPFSKSELIKL